MAGNVEIARSVLNEFASSHALDPARFTPTATWWTYLGGEVPIAEHARLTRQTATALFAGPGRFVVDEAVGADALVVLFARGFQPLRDGRSYDNTYVFAFRFEAGRIASIRAYFDTALAQRTLVRASG